MTPTKPTQQEQIDALRDEMAALTALSQSTQVTAAASAASSAAAASSARETHDMVSDLHRALIEPQPGQSMGLLNRMARVTISIESGERVAKVVIFTAAFIGAMGVIYAGLTTWGKS